MRIRPIVAVTIVIVLGLGIGWYATAQEDITLPNFTPGQVLTAQELNDIAEALDDLRNKVNQVEGRLTCNTEGSCNSDPALSDECQDFVGDCLSVADPQACIGGGLFICEEEELPPDVDEFNVCLEWDSCKIPGDARDKCNAFLNDCLEVAETDSDKEGCLGGALLICLEFEIEPEPPF